jgi:hypothetical protein
MPGFERISRISLRVTRLALTFEAAALFIFAGTTAIPSSRATAADKTISWVSVSFAMMFSSWFDSIRCHQHDPAMARGQRGRSASGRARTRTTALLAAQVQSDFQDCSGSASRGKQIARKMRFHMFL